MNTSKPNNYIELKKILRNCVPKKGSKKSVKGNVLK